MDDKYPNPDDYLTLNWSDEDFEEYYGLLDCGVGKSEAVEQIEDLILYRNGIFYI